MSKVLIATDWLAACAGCHMSLLDMDEAIVDVLAKADIVFGPLVDAQEWPEGTDEELDTLAALIEAQGWYEREVPRLGAIVVRSRGAQRY